MTFITSSSTRLSVRTVACSSTTALTLPQMLPQMTPPLLSRITHYRDLPRHPSRRILHLSKAQTMIQHTLKLLIVDGMSETSTYFQPVSGRHLIQRRTIKWKSREIKVEMHSSFHRSFLVCMSLHTDCIGVETFGLGRLVS